ncbi:MAG: Gfo/Idh/MocA family oxidoreductase [Planctomycetota bacterium]
MSRRRIKRRQFIKHIGGVALAGFGIPYIVSSSSLGLDGATAPSNRITFGCIGVGPQGTGNMSAFTQMDDVQIVAVCDVDRGYGANGGGQIYGREPARKRLESHYADQKSSGTYKGCAAFKDFRELLSRGDIDAVTVCTPDHWHGTISVSAAKAGKDIYCEKPLVNTIAEGRAVCDTVSRYERVLQTGSHERSNDSVRFACELVRNGRIGRVHTITVNMPNSDSHHLKILRTNQPQPAMPVPEGLDYDMWLGPAPRAAYTEKRSHFWWRFILDYGGGEMTDRGAHIIDLAQFINDSDKTGPVEISGTGAIAPGGGVFDAFMEYDFECKYANGVRLVGKSKGPRGLKIEGSDGWIFINIHGGRLEAGPEALLNEQTGPGEIQMGRSRSHHQNFIDSVRSRQQPFASAETGHRTATICHLLNIAMLTGRKLKWDPAKEVITGDEQANRMLSRPMRSPWHLYM